MWSGSVAATPGTGSAGSGCGSGWVGLCWQPADTQISPAVPSAAHSRLGDNSVARKGKRKFGFHVLIGPAGKVDGDLRDGAAGEHERRLEAAGHRRSAVA